MEDVVKILPKYKVTVVKKKTHEQYVMELKNINPHIIPIEQYINSNTLILHKCMKHNITWKITPSNVLKGCGCQKCKGKKISNKLSKSHEQYVNSLKIKNQLLVPIEKYINSYTAILHCCVNGHKVKISPSHALSGRGCKFCNREKNKELRQLTHDEYLKRLIDMKSTVIPLDKYNGMNTKILHTDITCYHEWMVDPCHILRGEGCPICGIIKSAKKRTKTNKQFLNDFYQNNPNSKDINIYGEYYCANKKIKCECKICNFIWETVPGVLLKNSRCPRCANKIVGEKLRKTHKQYIIDLKKKNPNTIVIEEYIDSYTSIEHKCLIHNYIWKSKPSNILSGYGCPICKESKGERNIRLFLESKNINHIIRQTYSELNGIGNKLLSYDFYLPYYNLLIEFQGEQHEKPIEFFGGKEQFKIQQEHDKRKREYAKNHNINLLEIWYYDINNIEDIITKYLNNLKLESVETTGIT